MCELRLTLGRPIFVRLAATFPRHDLAAHRRRPKPSEPRCPANIADVRSWQSSSLPVGTSCAQRRVATHADSVVAAITCVGRAQQPALARKNPLGVTLPEIVRPQSGSPDASNATNPSGLTVRRVNAERSGADPRHPASTCGGAL